LYSRQIDRAATVPAKVKSVASGGTERGIAVVLDAHVIALSTAPPRNTVTASANSSSKLPHRRLSRVLLK